MPYRDDLEALEHRCRALEAQASTIGDELAEARKLFAEAQAQRRLPVVDDLRVAAPCDADWAKMVGDERVRFCGSCKQSVYNLSGMTRVEAQALLVEKQGDLCIRYFQRADGTLLSSDCAVGVRRRRRRRRIVGTVIGGAFATVVAAVAAQRGPVDTCRTIEDMIHNHPKMGKYSGDGPTASPAAAPASSAAESASAPPAASPKPPTP